MLRSGGIESSDEHCELHSVQSDGRIDKARSATEFIATAEE